MSNVSTPATSDTPQLLLEHHLKQLRLPTFLREYDKLSRQGPWEYTALTKARASVEPRI